MSKRQLIGKVLYALIFLVIIPIGLWRWTQATEDIITFPGIQSSLAGVILISIGLVLILWAMLLLKTIGKGLPMNAFPPSKLVTNGPYRIAKHPIYVGFGILMVGCSVYFGSASGFWLITPLTILAMVALVMGYESIDLNKRFSNYKLTKTLVAFPQAAERVPDMRDRLISFCWLAAASLLSNYLAAVATKPNLSMNLEFRFTDSMLSFTPLIAPILVLATALMLTSKIQLRQWVLSGLMVVAVITFLNIFFPTATNLVLNSHAYSILFINDAILMLCIHFLWPKRIVTWWLILLIAVLLVYENISGASPVRFVFVSVLLYVLTLNHKKIWLYLRNIAEQIANSWKERTIGNIRIINHGYYAGVGAFIGILQAGILGGDKYTYAVLIFAVLVTISAALWAQVIEGSEKLKRPFGYYGGIVGIALASIAVWLLGYDVWIIIGLFSVSMPWVQAIGRLRCLVNGCCHGARTNNEKIGIRYFHDRSRVCYLSGAHGELLHPTQLYSILWLVPIGFIQLALWRSNYPYPFIFGLYLILTSLGRFAEEAYRGEVQTKILYGLRLYQWTALITCLVGIIMTTIHVPVASVSSEFGYKTIVSALLGGAFLTFAMGIDFPKSTARFSRLI